MASNQVIYRQSRPQRRLHTNPPNLDTSHSHLLPQIDCQTPEGRVIRKWDCKLHAKALHKRLQTLLETQWTPAAHLKHESEEHSTENTTTEFLSTQTAPMPPTQQRTSGSRDSTIVFSQHPSMEISCSLPPSPIREEVPRIEDYLAIVPGYNSQVGFSRASTSTSREADSNSIPLFDPRSLPNTDVRSVVSTNGDFNGYTSISDLAVQPPSYPFLDNMMETGDGSHWGTGMTIWQSPARRRVS